VNEQEQELYEAELRRARPARLPEPFMARLRAAKPAAEPARPKPTQRPNARPGWWFVWRWLAPAMAVAVVGLLVARAKIHAGSSAPKNPTATTSRLKADDVQVDQELVSSYDVVARLPGGEPVRFRCRKWRDQVSVTDTNLGVEIVENSPRVEVVPLRFETY
jgi:hypothetical protein